MEAAVTLMVAFYERENMERVAEILRIVGNYVARRISVEELILCIRKQCDMMEKEAK